MSIYNLIPCHSLCVTSPSCWQGEGGGECAATGMRSENLISAYKRALLITLSILFFSQVSFSKENQIGVDIGFVFPMNLKTSGNWLTLPLGPSLNYQNKKSEFTFGVNIFDAIYGKSRIVFLPKFGIRYHFNKKNRFSNFYIEQHTFIDKFAWITGGPTVRYNYQTSNPYWNQTDIARYRKINLEFNLGYECFTTKYFSLLISTGIAYTFQRSIEEKWNQQPQTFYNTYFYFPFRFGIKFHIFNIKKRTHESVEQNTGD